MFRDFDPTWVWPYFSFAVVILCYYLLSDAFGRLFRNCDLSGYGHILFLLLSFHVVILLSGALDRLCLVSVAFLRYGHILFFPLSFHVICFFCCFFFVLDLSRCGRAFPKHLHIPSGNIYNVALTSMQRHGIAATSMRRCLNVICPLGYISACQSCCVCGVECLCTFIQASSWKKEPL